MGIVNLREKYGKNANSQTILNRAAKAEIPGGQRLFDLLDYLYRIKGESKDLADVYEELKRVKREMITGIARKYELKSNQGEGHDDENSKQDAADESASGD